MALTNKNDYKVTVVITYNRKYWYCSVFESFEELTIDWKGENWQKYCKYGIKHQMAYVYILMQMRKFTKHWKHDPQNMLMSDG